MLCIQVPISETSCPLKKSWKLRCLSARNVVVRVLPFCCRAGSFSGGWEEGTFAHSYDAVPGAGSANGERERYYLLWTSQEVAFAVECVPTCGYLRANTH